MFSNVYGTRYENLSTGETGGQQFHTTGDATDKTVSPTLVRDRTVEMKVLSVSAGVETIPA